MFVFILLKEVYLLATWKQVAERRKHEENDAMEIRRVARDNARMIVPLQV